MKRTKASQKAHLLGGLSPNSKKKILATRGTSALVGDYKKTKVKSSSTSVLPFVAGWIVLSSFLWFLFFESIVSLVGLTLAGLALIYLLKKTLIKESSYQIISKIEQKKSLQETISDFSHLFNQEIKDEVDTIVQNLEYLRPYAEQKVLVIEQEHYLQQCRNKHLIDLFNILNESHKEHLTTNQESVCNQLKAISNKINRIIAMVQSDLEIKIKVKSVFTKDEK